MNVYILLISMNKLDRFKFFALVTVGLILTVSFTYWWFFVDHVPTNFNGLLHIFDYIIFGLLTYIVFHGVVNQVLLWTIVRKIKPLKYIKPEKGLKVAFITTFVPKSEPLELLHKILPAMVNADYPHDVWLLDEGNDRNARKICKQYGVNYFTRGGKDRYNTPEGKFAAKTKGGNHNAWYDAVGYKYDIVAQIDTDFIPNKKFLTKTLGYFKNPRIAFVGTPQVYGNMESLIAKGAAQQTYNFYGPILRGLAGREMTLMIGANHVVRVSALKEIDYYNAHLTEDLRTGMELHSQKWRSTYVPEVLAVGEGPSTWTAYFNQQMRWAFGCMHILFNHTPKLMKKMTRKRGGLYFLLQQHYFTGLAMAFGIFILLMYTILGIAPTSMDLFEMIVFYIPLVLWQNVIFLWLQKFFVDPKNERGLLLAGRVVSVAVWPIYFLALVGVLRGKRLVFKVTPKGDSQQSYTPLSIFKPQIVIALLMTIAFVFGSFITFNNSIVMMFWIILTAVFMYGLILSIVVPNTINKLKSLKFLKRTRPDLFLKL